MNFCSDDPPKWIMMNVKNATWTKTHGSVKLLVRPHLMAVPSHGGDGDPQWTSHEKSPKWMTPWERWAGELLKTVNIDLDLDTVKLDLRKNRTYFFFQSSCVLPSFLGISLSLYIRRHQNTTMWHCGMTWASETLRSTVSKQDEEKVGAFCKW